MTTLEKWALSIAVARVPVHPSLGVKLNAALAVYRARERGRGRFAL